MVGWGLSKSAEYQRQADYHAAKYAEYTSDKIGKSCPSPVVRDQYQCVAQARHEQRDYERNEQDLVAQKQSALWAYIMAAAAVMGVGLSVIGIFLVYITFDETRKGNAIAKADADRAEREATAARKALINAERAIIKISSANASPLPLDTGDGLMASLRLVNQGRSNATNFQIFYTVTDKSVFTGSLKGVQNFNGICIPGGEINLRQFKLRKQKKYPCWIIGYLSYSTMHEANFRTYFCRRIEGIPHQDPTYGDWANSSLWEDNCQNIPTDT
jgi:hypothetical protein